MARPEGFKDGKCAEECRDSGLSVEGGFMRLCLSMLALLFSRIGIRFKEVSVRHML